MRILISDKLNDLTGVGEEWLVSSNGDVIAVLIDGNLRGNSGDTAAVSHDDITI